MTRYQSTNNFEISGRLTSDPSVSTAKNGQKIVRFDIAHNFGKDMDPLFVSVVMFEKNGSKTVKIPMNLLKKGSPVTVSGYLRPNNFTTSEGKNIRRIDFVALAIEETEVRAAEQADPASETEAEATAEPEPQPEAEQPAPQPKKASSRRNGK